MSASSHRLQSIELDEDSLASVSRDQEQERQIAIYDLIEDNSFEPEGAGEGPFDLKIALIDNRLALDIAGPDYQRRHLLSLSPLRAVVKDYRMVCDSYYDAIRTATPQRIETLDMGRRGLHDEGSVLLKTRSGRQGRGRLRHGQAAVHPDLRPALARLMATRLPGAVLFACTLNRVRSPMAEGLTRRLFGNRVFVDSCGLRPDEEDGADPFAAGVMDELGVDLSAHRPKSFDDLEDTSFDLVISLSPEAQHRAVELARGRAVEIEYWPTHDPTLVVGSRDVTLEAYREVRDRLEARILERFGQVRTFGG